MHERFLACLRAHVCTALLLVAFLALGATHVAAQVDKGMIVGTVCDPTGAAVPDARVVVTNLATLVTQAAATNSDGQYVLLLIQVGTYSLDSAEFVASITQLTATLAPITAACCGSSIVPAICAVTCARIGFNATQTNNRPIRENRIALLLIHSSKIVVAHQLVT